MGNHILRVKAKWTGFLGAPGYSVFHFGFADTIDPSYTLAMAQACTNKVDTFVEAVKGGFPGTVSITLDPDVEELDESNGTISSAWTTTPAATHVGAASSSYAYSAAVGTNISWRTSSYRDGHKIRGRNFLVPLNSNMFQTNGALGSAFLATTNTAAATLRADVAPNPRLGVWARPRIVQTLGVPVNQNDGLWREITGHSIPAMGAVLRSRRD